MSVLVMLMVFGCAVVGGCGDVDVAVGGGDDIAIICIVRVLTLRVVMCCVDSAVGVGDDTIGVVAVV